ncbi:hypothetical protein CRG98_041127 [Punica granatum]|uniref:Uncharacterized protein n=1 Tax=Punica granatum TaxID=22663 RepID=A0A2I0I3E6_PUNGR|nr:hypothetical protein CRG98_041127 [Punica granatum]
MNSVPSFSRESLCGKPVGQNGVLTAPYPRGPSDGGSSYSSVTCSQYTVEGPNGLGYKGYLVTAPSDHLEDNAGQGRVDETMRARK